MTKNECRMNYLLRVLKTNFMIEYFAGERHKFFTWVVMALRHNKQKLFRTTKANVGADM